MKRYLPYLPGRREVFVFALIAVACALLASTFTAHDAAMSLMAFPIFVFAAVMGLWKSGRLRA